MDIEYKIYLERSENELDLAKIIFEISSNNSKKEEFKIKTTFYSAVISHSYYSIFYCAKTYLLTKGIKNKAPQEHKKT